MARRAPAPLVVLLSACFSEAPGSPSGDVDGTDPSGGNDTTATTGGTDGTSADPSGPTMASASMSTTTATSADATTDDPAETTDDPSAPVCGAMGDPCCADAECDEGVCREGTCAAFGGAFIYGELCDDCPNVLGATQCGCPGGFEASAPTMVLSSGCIKDGPKSSLPWTDELMHFCEAPTYVPGRSDWGGAYLVANTAGEGCEGMPDCVLGNRFADDQCGCPDQSQAVEVVIYAHCGDGSIPEPPPAYRLGFCLGDAPPTTIAGVVYRQGDECLQSYPEGNCACPDGFPERSMRVIGEVEPNMAGDLGFCVRE